MTRIEFRCDRCTNRVMGVHNRSGTAGFFIVDQPPFSVFGREGEHFVCDVCLHQDLSFQGLYGIGGGNRERLNTKSGDAG